MKTYTVAVEHIISGEIIVKANSPEEATDMAYDMMEDANWRELGYEDQVVEVWTDDEVEEEEEDETP